MTNVCKLPLTTLLYYLKFSFGNTYSILTMKIKFYVYDGFKLYTTIISRTVKRYIRKGPKGLQI